MTIKYSGVKPLKPFTDDEFRGMVQSAEKDGRLEIKANPEEPNNPSIRLTEEAKKDIEAINSKVLDACKDMDLQDKQVFVKLSKKTGFSPTILHYLVVSAHKHLDDAVEKGILDEVLSLDEQYKTQGRDFEKEGIEEQELKQRVRNRILSERPDLQREMDLWY